MPIRLEPRDIPADFERFTSILVVSCPVCPAVSLALQEKKPLFEPFKHGVKTEAFEDYVKSVRKPLEQRGIRTDAYTMRVPHPLMCLWTKGQRRRLRNRARRFDAVLVLGCYSAAHTARAALEGIRCEVFHGMRELGLTNATVRFRRPMTVELDAHRIPHEPWATSREARAGATPDLQRESR